MSTAQQQAGRAIREVQDWGGTARRALSADRPFRNLALHWRDAPEWPHRLRTRSIPVTQTSTAGRAHLDKTTRRAHEINRHHVFVSDMKRLAWKTSLSIAG